MASERAPAKVNLFLRVTGRRSDGYHLLESLVVFAEAADLVEVEELGGASRPPQTPRHQLKPKPINDGGFGGSGGEIGALRRSPRGSPHPTLTLTGPFGPGLAADPDNLVLRAARALGVSAPLVLEKHLPVASGIGGGSADAAATLRLLARLFGLPAPSPELALALGADVPVCLASTPCIMRGIGEDISPAPALPTFGLALVNPGIGVATAAIFKARQGAFSPPVTLPEAWPDATTMAADLAAWGNDLQPPAEALCPPITEVLAALHASPGCLLAQMSGSGATCFGIYPTPQAAAAAAEAVRRPGWWSWGGALFSGAAATV